MERIILNQISAQDLSKTIAEEVREKIQDLILQGDKSEQYLTRQQTADLLQISLVTLNKWSSLGILQSYRIGGRIRYKASEIESAL